MKAVMRDFQYTIANALQWENCFHNYENTKEAYHNGRYFAVVGYGLLTTLEALPVIGQIVALAETIFMKMRSCCCQSASEPGGLPRASDSEITNVIRRATKGMQALSTPLPVDHLQGSMISFNLSIDAIDLLTTTNSYLGIEHQDSKTDEQKAALKPYIDSVTQKLLSQIASLETIPAFQLPTKRQVLSTPVTKRPDNEHQRNNHEITSKESISTCSAITSGYNKGYSEREITDGKNRCADLCQSREILGSNGKKGWISCHIDGSDSGHGPANLAHNFTNKYLEFIEQSLQDKAVTNAKEQLEMIMSAVAEAQAYSLQQMKDETAACGTMMVSLTLPNQTGGWQHIAVSVGDIDLVHIRDHKTNIPSFGARENPLDVTDPGGQIGYSKLEFLPDFSNLKVIILNDVQPGDTIITFSDGVMDNFGPQSQYKSPYAALKENSSLLKENSSLLETFHDIQSDTTWEDLSKDKNRFANLSKTYLQNRFGTYYREAKPPKDFLLRILQSTQTTASQPKKKGVIVKPDDMSANLIFFK
jgi:hypothetical protein